MSVLVDSSDPTAVKVLYDPIEQKVLASLICRGSCSSPCTGNCLHSVSFQVKFDQSEIDNDFSILFSLSSTDGLSFIDLRVDSFEWRLSGGTTGGDSPLDISIYTDDVPFQAGIWYSVQVCLNVCDSEFLYKFVTATLCVCGSSVTGTGKFAVIPWATTIIGDPFTPDIIHRSYRNVALHGDTDFNFPPDSFDSVVNGTTTGSILRLDSDGLAAYGEKDYSDPTCETVCEAACCFNNRSCVVETNSACEAAGGIYQGDGTNCLFDICPGLGACCNGTDCTIIGRETCEGNGWIYLGDGITCSGDPCGSEPIPISACCYGNPECPDPHCNCPYNDCECDVRLCAETTQVYCEGTLSGVWATWSPFVGGWHCIRGRCGDPECGYEIPVGGCCDPYFDPGACILADMDSCAAALGSYLGDGSDCSGGCP